MKRLNEVTIGKMLELMDNNGAIEELFLEIIELKGKIRDLKTDNDKIVLVLSNTEDELEKVRHQFINEQKEKEALKKHNNALLKELRDCRDRLRDMEIENADDNIIEEGGNW